MFCAWERRKLLNTFILFANEGCTKKEIFFHYFIVNWKGLTAAQHWRTMNSQLNPLYALDRLVHTDTDSFQQLAAARNVFNETNSAPSFRDRVQKHVQECLRHFFLLLFLFGSRSSTLWGYSLIPARTQNVRQPARTQSTDLRNCPVLRLEQLQQQQQQQWPLHHAESWDIQKTHLKHK